MSNAVKCFTEIECDNDHVVIAMTESKMEIRAEVVDRVGRNAYWSVRVSKDGGERKAPYIVSELEI